MLNSRWADRIEKVGNRVQWLAQACRVPSPNVERIYPRRTGREAVASEFVKRCVGPAYIEPEFGYVISGEGAILQDSLLPNPYHEKPPWRIGLPSWDAFARGQRDRAGQTERYPRVISLRHFWEWNYYHFYVDVLGKLPLLEKAGLDATTPLVLGRYAQEMPFVQELLGRGSLKARNWIIQNDAYLLADEIYYCRSLQPAKTKLDYLLNTMCVPCPPPDDEKRLFLTRKPGGPRSISNLDAVETVLREYHFCSVDTSEMPLAEQIDLFSRTRYLVAVHGAGMINMIFRQDAPLSILELYPLTWDSTCFFDIGQEFGYQAARLACQPADHSDPQHANLHVNLTQLRQHLEKMVAEQPPSSLPTPGMASFRR